VAELSRAIAYVFQDPDSQLCALTVEDEIAFALENRCMEPAAIDRCVDAALAEAGLPIDFRRRRTQTLSGGEKQKVLLAAVLAKDAPTHVCEEVPSQLDPTATAATYEAIARLASSSRERTLIFIDHKLESLLSLIDRVFLLDGSGRLVATAPPATLFHDEYERVAGVGAWCPPAADLCNSLRRAGVTMAERPLSMSAAVDAVTRAAGRRPELRRRIGEALERWSAARPPRPLGSRGRPLLRLDGASFAPRGAPTILADISLTLHAGEIVGLIGHNGAGKSTLGMLIAGLVAPTRGERAAADGERPTGPFVFQNPEHQFVAGTVREELLAGQPPASGGRVEAAWRDADLGRLRDAHPYELSQGQKRKLSVLAMTTAGAAPLLVLDEPSYGLDARATGQLQAQIARERSPDRAIVVISHDLDLIAALCDRIAVLDHGRLARIDRADAVLGDARFLAAMQLAMPAAYRMRGWLDALA